MAVTQALAEFIAGFPADRIPSPAFEAATRAVLDTLGVALAGAVEPPAALAARLAPDLPAGSAVWGQNRRSTPAYAALINGAAAHALDYDDVQHSLRGHPSAPTLPALFAVAEAAGRSGRGPTTLMCPSSTLINWGSSSREKRRRIAPSLVRRGSPGLAQTGPVSASASGRIVRNLMMGKGLPSRPTRSWT